LDLTDIKEIEVPPSQVERFCLRNGDVLLTEGGDFDKLGRGSIWNGEIPDCVHQNHVFAVRVVDRAVLLPEFLACEIQSSRAKNYFLSCAKQTTNLASINSSQLKELPVLVPPLVEQRAIINASAAWDTAIQKTEQLIAAKGRYYAGLVNRLITVRSRTEGWRRVSVRDIADRVQRQGDGGDYPLLTISSASGFIRQDDRYSRYMAGESAKTYTLLRAGEFSYNKGNSKRYEFGCVFQVQSCEAALVPSVYVSFRFHDSVCAAYMRHLFAADYLKPQLRALVKTGVRNNGLLNIRPDEFMGATVPLPPLEEQTRIANALEAASAETDLLRQQLAGFRAQKRGLMQKLLTGQWRLHVPEDEEAIA
jgi:type I restriction enzyme S subunit